jgi:hypothetical protein
MHVDMDEDVHVKHSLLLRDFNYTWHVMTTISKTVQHQA